MIINQGLEGAIRALTKEVRARIPRGGNLRMRSRPFTEVSGLKEWDSPVLTLEGAVITILGSGVVVTNYNDSGSVAVFDSLEKAVRWVMDPFYRRSSGGVGITPRTETADPDADGQTGE